MLKSALKWSAALLLTLVIGGALAAGAALYLLQKKPVQQLLLNRINRTIPGEISWDRLTFSLFKGEISINGLALAGPEGDFLAGLERFYLDIKIKDLLSGRLTAASVLMTGARADLSKDSTGALNLISAFPAPKDAMADTSGNTGGFFPFNIVVEKFLLESSRLKWSVPAESLFLQLEGIGATLSGNLADSAGEAGLEIETGFIQSAGTTSRLHSLKLNAALAGGNLSPLYLKFKTDNSHLELKGQLDSLFQKPSVKLFLNSFLNLEEIRAAAGIGTQLSGNLAIEGKIRGQLTDPEADLDVHYDGGVLAGWQLHSLHTALALKAKRVRLDRLHADAPWGSALLSGGVDLADAFPEGFGDSPVSLSALAYDLKLASKGLFLSELPLKVNGLQGALKGQIAVKGSGLKPRNLKTGVSARLSLKGFALDPMPAPSDGSLQLDGRIAESVAVLDNLELNANSVNLQVVGGYHILQKRVDNGHITLNADDLAQVLPLAGVDSISGQLTLEAGVSGAVTQPSGHVRLRGRNLSYKNLQLEELAVDAGLSDSGNLTLENLALANGNSRIRAEGHARLFRQGKMSAPGDMSVNLKLSAEPFVLEDFIDSLKGRISLQAEAKGPVSALDGSISLEAEDLEAGPQPVKKIMLQANLDSGAIALAPLEIRLTGSDIIQARGRLNRDSSYQINLSSSNIQLSRLQALNFPDSTFGVLKIDLSGEGTIQKPGATGSLCLNELSFKGESLAPVCLELALKDSLLRLRSAGELWLDAAYHIRKQDYHGKLAFQRTDLQTLFLLAGRPELTGRISGKIEARGNVSRIDTVQAGIMLEELLVQFQGLPLVSAGKAQLSYRDGRIGIDSLRLRLGGEGWLNITGQGTVKGPYQFRASGNVPLSLAGAYQPDLSSLKGYLALDAGLAGTAEVPDITGSIELQDVAINPPGLVQRLHDLNGLIRFAGDSVWIEGLHGKLDEGGFRIGGGMGLQNFQPRSLSMSVVANALPVGIPEQLDMKGDVNLKLKGGIKGAELTGEIVVLEGLFYRDIKIDLLQGVGKKTRKVAPPSEKAGVPFLDNLRFNVGIKDRVPFKVDNNMAQLDLSIDLSLIGSMSRPALGGRANILSGTVHFRGQNFAVKKGIIDFLDPYAVVPTLGIESEASIGEYIITLRLDGPPENLVFKLSASPYLEDEDILALLITGKTTAEIESGGSGGPVSAEALLAQALANLAAGRIKQKAGLDILEIQTGAKQSNQTGESERVRVTVGKQLSRRLAAKYAVESEAGEVKQKAIAEYKLLENLLFSGYQDTEGAYGGEVKVILEFW